MQTICEMAAGETQSSTHHIFLTKLTTDLWKATKCSLCRLISRPGGLSVCHLGTHCGSPQQTERHSFGNHLISESVSSMPPSVTEASF
jgi:hypothetical protein